MLHWGHWELHLALVALEAVILHWGHWELQCCTGGTGSCDFALVARGAMALRWRHWELCPVLVATGSCSPRARVALGAVVQGTLVRAGNCDPVHRWVRGGRTTVEGQWGILGAGGGGLCWELGGTEGNWELGEPWDLGRDTGSRRGRHWELQE